MHVDGDKLRAARERLGLTQVELAERVGITEATVNRLERGHHQPRITTVRKLAAALNLAISDLATWPEMQEAAE